MFANSTLIPPTLFFVTSRTHIGPVAVSVDAEKGWQSYKKGVMPASDSVHIFTATVRI